MVCVAAVVLRQTLRHAARDTGVVRGRRLAILQQVMEGCLRENHERRLVAGGGFEPPTFGL